MYCPAADQTQLHYGVWKAKTRSSSVLFSDQDRSESAEIYLAAVPVQTLYEVTWLIIDGCTPIAACCIVCQCVVAEGKHIGVLPEL